MIFINSSPIFFAIWMILGIISYLLHPKIKDELGRCLNSGKFFHLFVEFYTVSFSLFCLVR